ncbi:unnamed protein product [Leuciscus chuanchicus]
MHIISVLILMLRSGFCCKSQEVHRGVDVSLRCEVSFLSESSTLQWERDGEQTSNTTLLYNNSAYILLHTVDEHSQGKYYCRLMEDGRVETVRNHTLNVSSHSYNRNNKINTIYRKSSNNSDVSLICKSKKEYHRWKWTWEPRPNSQTDLIAVEKGREVQVKGPIKPGRLSSTTYNSQSFIFHISPVNFNYSGKYKCITNYQKKDPYTTTMLRTIRVSVEPPDGVLRNQSVILTCEVSEVTDSVMLVWLRMEGNRGVLGKQQIMSEKNKKLQLTVNLSSSETEHWQCAVFTEDTLRALAPITISLSSSTETSTVPNQEDMTQESHLQIVIIVVCAVTVVTGTVLILLLGLLVFKRQRKTDEVHVTGLKSQEDEDIHYASVTFAGSSQGDDSWFKTDHASSEVPTLVVDGQVDDLIVGSNVIKHLIKELKKHGGLMEKMRSNVDTNSEDSNLIQLLANVERWNGTVVPEKLIHHVVPTDQPKLKGLSYEELAEKQQTDNILARVIFYVERGKKPSNQECKRELVEVVRLLRSWSVEKSHTTPYHPMGNGGVERFNRTLGNMIRALPPTAKQRKDNLIRCRSKRGRKQRSDKTSEAPSSLLFSPLFQLNSSNSSGPSASAQRFSKEHLKEALAFSSDQHMFES